MSDRLPLGSARWLLPGALLLLLPAGRGLANDGRDRYQHGTPNLFFHLDQPLAPGAGYRVLPHDLEGGADGEPMFRWAQSVPLAVVELAARRTVTELGLGPVPAALFDLSAENGDTPIDFDPSPSAAHRPRPPRGRHPGGSHDGGVNLDVGYYLTSVKGKLLAEDLAACTEHYDPVKLDARGRPLDLNRCVGSADRLDVERQAMFYLELLRLNRDRFDNQLLDEIGVDEAVFKAVRQRLQSWSVTTAHGTKPIDVLDLQAICTFDRWDGWQKYHHHHTHLRFHPISRTGPLRTAVQGIEREARKIRASMAYDRHSTWPAALDARLLSYRLERAVEVHLVEVPGRPSKVASVRYRLAGGEWQLPDNADDDQRYLFDLPVALQPAAGSVRVEAEVTLLDNSKAQLTVSVALPRQEPRLRVGHVPGTIEGQSAAVGGRLRLSVMFPNELRHLVTSVNYRVYPSAGGEAVSYRVDAGWFAPDPDAGGAADPRRSRSTEPRLDLTLPRQQKGTIGWVEAEVMLSGRLAVTVPIHLSSTSQ